MHVCSCGRLPVTTGKKPCQAKEKRRVADCDLLFRLQRGHLRSIQPPLSQTPNQGKTRFRDQRPNTLSKGSRAQGLSTERNAHPFLIVFYLFLPSSNRFHALHREIAGNANQCWPCPLTQSLACLTPSLSDASRCLCLIT